MKACLTTKAVAFGQNKTAEDAELTMLNKVHSHLNFWYCYVRYASAPFRLAIKSMTEYLSMDSFLL